MLTLDQEIIGTAFQALAPSFRFVATPLKKKLVEKNFLNFTDTFR